MRRFLFIIILLLSLCCMAQSPSTLTINVKGYKFDMIKIEGDTFLHQNLCGDTIRKYYHLAPIDSLRAYNGYSTIRLSDFYIGKFEVTCALYEKVMKKNPSYYYYKYANGGKNIADNFPIETVSWYDAMEFIDSLNRMTGMHFRLPTEMEWEYAASGGTAMYLYSGSDNHDAIAWGWENGRQRTHPVGQKLPNGFGLYDMSGNVAEWCSDWFSSYFYQPNGFYDNPTGPKDGEKKVTKGGSWGNYDRYLEYRTRVGNSPKEKSNGIGFRLAMDAE